MSYRFRCLNVNALLSCVTLYASVANFYLVQVSKATQDVSSCLPCSWSSGTSDTFSLDGAEFYSSSNHADRTK